MIPHELKAALRRLPEGCYHCKKPVTQMIASNRGRGYYGSCAWHSISPHMDCNEYEYHSHSENCSDSTSRVIPLTDLLEELGVEL